jgi:hypothetical protein
MGTASPLRRTRAPATVVESRTRPSLADAGADPNLKVAGFAVQVARRSDRRVGSAARISVAVAGASVKLVVVTVKLMYVMFQYKKHDGRIAAAVECKRKEPGVATGSHRHYVRWDSNFNNRPSDA